MADNMTLQSKLHTFHKCDLFQFLLIRHNTMSADVFMPSVTYPLIMLDLHIILSSDKNILAKLSAALQQYQDLYHQVDATFHNISTTSRHDYLEMA